jgi:hypothetical protein
MPTYYTSFLIVCQVFAATHFTQERAFQFFLERPFLAYLRLPDYFFVVPGLAAGVPGFGAPVAGFALSGFAFAPPVPPAP